MRNRESRLERLSDSLEGNRIHPGFWFVNAPGDKGPPPVNKYTKEEYDRRYKLAGCSPVEFVFVDPPPRDENGNLIPPEGAAL